MYTTVQLNLCVNRLSLHLLLLVVVVVEMPTTARKVGWARVSTFKARNLLQENTKQELKSCSKGWQEEQAKRKDVAKIVFVY